MAAKKKVVKRRAVKRTVIIKSAPPVKTVRQALNQIDGWLCDAVIGEALANVLAALRGPDSTFADHIKQTTTVPIRRAAFPKLAAKVASAGMYGVGWSMDPQRFDQTDAYRVSTHFGAHIEWASSALKLSRGDRP